MTRRLSTRLALAMTAVALLSALLAGALSAPLLDRAVEDATQEPLARQAELLARLPMVALTSERLDRYSAGAGLALGAIAPDGSATGAALALSESEQAQAVAGRSLSTKGELGGVSVLIEARPARGGGAVVLATDLDSVDAAADRLRRRVLLAIGAGLAAAILLALIVATRIGRPLEQTASAARRLAHGERGVPLPEPGTREVADVAEALGSLDRALTTSEDRQRQFLLSVSHELRTPMTAVRGYGEALADGMIPTEDLPSVGRTLADEAQRMERYVADLLTLARTEAEDFSVTRLRVDVTEILRETVRAWSERATRSGILLHSVAPRTLFADTDPERLRQVLDVLVDNAIRICPSGSTVVLDARAATDGVLVEVRDSGPGLTEDDRRDAFRPGVLHARYASERGGSHGLGLAIAERLVNRLGGTIRAEQAPEGGAAFLVGLPTAK